jgi:hypothetical protein
MKRTNRYATKCMSVYMRRLTKWSKYFTEANKNTPAELRLWNAFLKARKGMDTRINVPGLFRALNQPFTI